MLIGSRQQIQIMEADVLYFLVLKTLQIVSLKDWIQQAFSGLGVEQRSAA